MLRGTALLLLVAFALQRLARAGLIGVAPQDAGRYAVATGALFRCFDGSGEFAPDAVNDDFCDCADGSDEPGTGACAGRTGAHFYCANAGSVPKLLYTSRVRDGICDCCDGSDEASGRCPDTCEAEGALVRADRERRRTALVDGLRVLRESEEKARASAAAWREEVEALQKEAPALEAAEANATAQVEEARKVVDAVNDKNLAQEAAKSGTVLSEDFEDADAESRWQRATGGGFRIADDPKGERGKVLAMTGCTWGGDAFSLKGVSCSASSKCTLSFWARGAAWQGFSRGTKRTEEPAADAHSWLAVPSENPDFRDRLATTQSSDDWVRYEYTFPEQDTFQMLGDADATFSSGKVHIMVQAHDSTGRCADTMFDDFRVWKDDVSVLFIDGDGDKVSFRINDVGALDAYGNDELMVGSIEDLTTEGRMLHFGSYRAQAPSEADVKRVVALYERSLGGRKSATASAASPPAAASAGGGAAGDGGEQSSAPQEGAEKAKTPEISEYAKWALDQESGSAGKPDEGPSGEKSSEDTGGAEKPKAPEISEYAKWALDQEPGSADEPGGEDRSDEKSSDSEEAAPGAGDGASTSRSWNRVLARRPSGDSEADQALRKADEALEDAKSKLGENRKRQEELEKKLKQMHEDPRQLAMSDACVEKHIQQYRYKICFFGDAKQDHVSLGTFREWEGGSNSSVLLFTNGQYCHGGPARSLRVRLLCGPEGVLNDVSEPSRCSYEAEVVHPGGCRQEDLQALEEPAHARVLGPHEEL